MRENKEKQYNPAIDALRLVSILAVILIHTTTRTLEAANFDLQRTPWTLFLNQISRFAVPLFFMISGLVLELNYSFHPNYLTYLRKRFNRLFVPYVFWSGVYYFFIYTNHNINFLSALIQGSSSYQLYFIPTLLIFYIFFPLVHKFYNVISNKWTLIFLGIFQIALLYYDYYIHPIMFSYPIKIAFLNYYIFLLGIVVSHHRESLMEFIKKWKIPLSFLTIILANYIFFEGGSLYLKTHNYLSFYSQWRPDVFLYTLTLGSLLYYFFSKRTLIFPIIQKLSRLSFFVFFVHVIVLENIWHKIALPIFQKSHTHIAGQLWYDPLFFLVITLVSFGIAFAIHKIPILPKLTG